MIRRYVVPCFLILVVALGAVGLDYVGSGKTLFAAPCVIQVVIRPADQPAQTTEAITVLNRFAQHELILAKASGVFAKAAKAHGVSAGTLASETVVNPLTGIGTFTVTVIDKDRKRSPVLANAVCDEIVLAIKKQRSDEANAEIATAKDRMNSSQSELKHLQTIPAKKRTLSQAANVKAQLSALVGNAELIARILSQLPDDISVLNRASAARNYDPRHLSKNLLIGLAAGVFVCFLYVLAVEVISEQRNRR
jgi:hypothetical protein